MSHHGHSHGPDGYTDDEDDQPPKDRTLTEAPRGDSTTMSQPVVEPKYDPYQMSQRGLLKPFKDLVEAKQFTVNTRDAEGITCMHWAAINNRVQFVEYLVSQGAEIDPVGGDLVATPLQWAVRQGHMEMVVMLIKKGADPHFKDRQGFNSLHLAAQFGFANLCAYLIAKGVDVDSRDNEGHTALMWAAYKNFQPDPIRLLLTLNASMSTTDTTLGNTALHYAVMANNVTAVQLLLDAGANRDIRNKECLSAVDLVYRTTGTDERRPRALMMMMPRSTEARGIQSIAQNASYRRKVLLCLPFFGIAGAGLAFHVARESLLKAGAILIVTLMSWSMAANLFRPKSERERMSMAMAMYLGTKVLMYLTTLYLFWPLMSGPEAITGYGLDLVIIVGTVSLWYNFIKANQVDPGYVPISIQARFKTIVDLAENSMLDPSAFCSTCVIRKPLRSKHCGVCGRCVAKFDHHCPFVDNCVGQNNHRHFMFFLMSLITIVTCFWIVALRYFALFAGATDDDNLWTTIKKYFLFSPWVCWMLANGSLHLLWVSALTVSQLKQIATGVTTNEQFNQHRYHHLAGGAPWSKGCVGNLVEFFADPHKTDWTKTYTQQPKPFTV